MPTRCRHYAKLPRDLLRRSSVARWIGRFGLGVDNIDIPAATQCGITVTYVPDYACHEVSDHAMAVLLALVRKIPFSNRLVQSGRWEMPPSCRSGACAARFSASRFRLIPAQAVAPRRRLSACGRHP